MKYLYLFRQTGTNDYKIGVSKHPDKRILELNVGNPQKMELIFQFETSVPYKLEKALHKFFSSMRYENSEWFLFNELDLENFKEKCFALDQKITYLKDNNTFCYNFS